MPYQIRQLAFDLRLPDNIHKKFLLLTLALYKTFIECDASLIEINPLALTTDDQVLALDAKMSIDDNALYRQELIGQMRDHTQEDRK